MIDVLPSWGRLAPADVADAGHGEIAAFRRGLSERDINYVVAVRSSATAHLAYAGRGPRGLPLYQAPAPALKVLAIATGRKELHQVIWRHGTKTRPATPPRP